MMRTTYYKWISSGAQLSPSSFVSVVFFRWEERRYPSCSESPPGSRSSIEENVSSSSGDDSAENEHVTVLKAISASWESSLKPLPQRWPDTILLVPEDSTSNLRVLNRQVLSLFLDNTVRNENKNVRLISRRNILAHLCPLIPKQIQCQTFLKLGHVKVASTGSVVCPRCAEKTLVMQPSSIARISRAIMMPLPKTVLKLGTSPQSSKKLSGKIRRKENLLKLSEVAAVDTDGLPDRIRLLQRDVYIHIQHIRSWGQIGDRNEQSFRKPWP